jgi:phage-related protein
MSEVGSGQVAIFPTFSGFRSKVTSETAGAGRDGGKTFSSSFSAGAGDPGAALVKKLNAQIASGSKALSTARLTEQDAAGKVRVAEAALNEARAKGGSETARSIAAEERLETAKRKLTDAQLKTKMSSDQLRDSQSKLADAMSAAGASGEQASTRFSRGWAGLKGKLTGTVKGAVDDAGNAAHGAADDAGKKSGGAFSGAFKGALGALAGVFAAQQFGSLFKSSVADAANLEQSIGAIGTVFKGSSGDMNAWADSAATDVGLSKNEFNELGTLIGSQLKNGGTAMEELAPKTKSLITLGADLSSMFGGTTADAVGALSSALKGERDPIEKYGVSLNQAKIDAEAAALGFSKVDGSLSSEANQAATLSLIMKQTADAHGNFGRETDTLAHKQQVLNAQLANGKARIGTELMPVVSAFTGLLSKILGPAINGTVSGIRKIVGAGQGLYDLFAKGDFSSALRNAFNVEEDSALVSALFRARDVAIEVGGGFRAMFAAYKAGDGDITSSGFAGFMERVGAGLREGVGGVRAFFAAFKAGDGDVTSGGFAGFLENLGFLARTVFDAVAPAVAGLLPQIVSLWSAFSPLQIIFQAIQPLMPQIVAMFGLLASTIGGTLSTVLTTIVPMFMQLSAVISQALGTVLATVLPVAVQMISMLSSTFSELMPVILPIITTIIMLATSLISQLAPIVTNLISSILPPLVSIFGNILSAIGPVISMVAGLLIPIIQALMPVVVTVFSVIAQVITAAMQIVQGIIQVVTGIITGNWAQVWEGIGNIFGGIWNLIVAVVSGAIAIVRAQVMAGLGFVSGFVGGTLGNIGGFFSDTWNNVIGGVSGFIGTFLGFFTGLPGKIMGALSGAGTFLLSIGQDMVQGLINGAKGMVDKAVQAIKDVGGAMLDGVKGFLGIKSPSIRFRREVGQQAGEGTRLGILDKVKSVAAAARQFVTIPDVPVTRAAAAAAAGRGTGATAGGSERTYNFYELSNPRATALQVTRLQEEQ